jgi:hypothetical protein
VSFFTNCPTFQTPSYGELPGSVAILAISAVIPVILGFLSQEKFDYNKLRQMKDFNSDSPTV